MKKYKFTDNLGLKIIAVIFAAFLWLIVVNLDNPVSTQTFSEIPVTIINEDIIVGEANGNIIYLKHCNLLAPKFMATFSKLLLIFFKIL